MFNDQPGYRPTPVDRQPRCPRAAVLVTLVLLILASPAFTAPAHADRDAPVEVEQTPTAESPTASPAEKPQTDLIRVPDQATPIIPLDEVKVGMRGYGLTVFHGTKIEPFKVEVISVSPNRQPGRAVIWVRCDHPTLDVSGPVQGMSGSPIYLWSKREAENAMPGEGGRLAGAFAYGWSQQLEPIAGVQPIELMRDVSSRADLSGERIEALRVAGSPEPQRRPSELLRLIDRFSQTASDDTLDRFQAAQAGAIAALLRGHDTFAAPITPTAPTPPSAPSLASPSFGPLGLPMPVGDERLAHILHNLFDAAAPGALGSSGGSSDAPSASLSLVPMAGPLPGSPPDTVDATTTAIEPGSVLAVPFVWGDLDLAGVGTATEVLPDGRVLAFGHGMDALGDLALPVATGYVHTFIANRSTSRKFAGTLRRVGTLVRDEQTAVVALPRDWYDTARARVRVALPTQPVRTYQYTLADSATMTPRLAPAVLGASISAMQNPPVEHTAHVRATMRLTGGDAPEPLSFAIDTRTVAGPGGVVAAAAPVLAALYANPFTPVRLEDFDADIQVQPGRDAATIVNAWMPTAQAHPGERLTVHLSLRTFRGQTTERSVSVRVPTDLPPGQYPLHIMSGEAYLAQYPMLHPQRLESRNLAEFADGLRALTRVQPDTLYTALVVPEGAVQVGRRSIAKLPASRRALMVNENSTLAQPTTRVILQQHDFDTLFSGRLDTQITVLDPDQRD